MHLWIENTIFEFPRRSMERRHNRGQFIWKVVVLSQSGPRARAFSIKNDRTPSTIPRSGSGLIVRDRLCVLVKRYLLLAKSIAVSILRCKIPRCKCVKNTFKSVSTSTTRILKTTNTKCRYYLIIRWYKTKFISFRIDRKQPYIQHYNQWKTTVL